jgi:hypothetical protein
MQPATVIAQAKGQSASAALTLIMVSRLATFTFRSSF